MAGEAKALEDVFDSLVGLRNCIEGTVDRTIPSQLDKPWKSFEKTNQDVIDTISDILRDLKKSKRSEFDEKQQEEIDRAKKKWEATNNVYPGLLAVMGQCETALECWLNAEKCLKKI
jgi:hypothetical protein